MEQRPEPAGGRGGEDGPAPLAPAPRSVPMARGWMAERKMAARCAAASHVPGDTAERLPHSPSPRPHSRCSLGCLSAAPKPIEERELSCGRSVLAAVRTQTGRWSPAPGAKENLPSGHPHWVGLLRMRGVPVQHGHSPGFPRSSCSGEEVEPAGAGRRPHRLELLGPPPHLVSRAGYAPRAAVIALGMAVCAQSLKMG